MSNSTNEPVPSKEPRVGITLITGFLGAGKSTLIRRVLTERHQLRIVVVENEFAENSSVEQAIVTQGIGPNALEQFIELPNGCICCAAQDDLTDALQRLVRSKRGLFDHILVEASGLADPAPVAASLWVDDAVDSSLFLDAVVTIVDAVNLEKWLNNTEDTKLAALARKQLAVADLVLLNKVDLLDTPTSGTTFTDLNNGKEQDCSSGILEEKLSRVTHIIRGHGCTAQIIPATRCNVDLSRLLNIRAYQEGLTLDAVRNVNLTAETLFGHGHTHVPSARSITLTFAGDSFEANKLDRVLGEMLWQDEEFRNGGESFEVWRMKGFAIISGELFKRIYQSVHTLFDHSSSSILARDDMTSCFVFIGRGLDNITLRRHLSRALKRKTCSS